MNKNWAAYPPEFNDGHWTVQNDEGLTIVVCGGDTQENKAVADLIAAAPKLLDALKSLLDIIPPNVWDSLPETAPGFYDQVNSVADMATTAINKAIGQTNQ